MATFREKLEGRLVPLLIGVLGMKRFAMLVISQGLKQVSKERADWVVGLIADQDRNLMVTALQRGAPSGSFASARTHKSSLLSTASSRSAYHLIATR
jgi:hypothetical protein